MSYITKYNYLAITFIYKTTASCENIVTVEVLSTKSTRAHRKDSFCVQAAAKSSSHSCV